MSEDDIVLEPENDYGEVKTPDQKLKEIRELLKQVQKERAEYLEGWQRSKADYINAKKRSDEEREFMAKTATMAVIMDIIPVMDSFEHALSHLPGEGDLKKGIQNTYAQLSSVLGSHGVSDFDPKGEPFDPEKHEAVKILDVSDAASDNIVTTVFQKGYSLHGKIIRPARVEIGHFEKK